MPRSRKKHSRAALRARSRRNRTSRSSSWFVATMVVICVVGIVGVVAAAGIFSRDEAAAAPQPGDHWHAALGVNVCGEWLEPPATFETTAGNSSIRAGIHTHGDGFIHIHPFTAAEGGSHATLGRFFDYGGWSVSSDSFKVWSGPSTEPQKITWSNGDRCPSEAGEAGKGKPGRVVFQVDCKTVTGNPADHKLADQEVVAIGFLPKGEAMGAPPNAASAPENDAGPGSTPKAIDKKGCRPSAENNPGLPETVPTTGAATTPTTTPATPTTQR